MNIVYLSHPLSSTTPTFAKKGKLSLIQYRTIKTGSSSNETELLFYNHIGTHIDAPYHFDDTGKKLTEYEPNFWICRNNLLLYLPDTQKNELINIRTVEKWKGKLKENVDLLLIKTDFEKYRNDTSDQSPYIFNGPGIHPELSDFLRRETQVRFIGFDFLSLTSFNYREEGRLSHRILLKTNDSDDKKYPNDPILIIEDMKLSELHSTPNTVLIAPFLFDNSDGAPVTVFASNTNIL